MNMTRKSKIARLPNVIRQELNERLRDGGRLDDLSEWLNSLPKVKAIMEAQFEGKAVSEQNISDWKKAGYADWLRDEEAKSWLAELKGGAEVLEKAVDGVEISKLFSARLAVEMTRLAQALLDKEAEPEKRWERACAVHKEISRMRRDDMWNVRTQVWQERWQQELKELGEAEEAADRPGNWMTPEERAAQQRRIYGTATPEDYEVLKAGRQRFLTKKEKRQYLADAMHVSEEEEKEGLKSHACGELSRKTREAQEAAVIAWLERENSARKSRGVPAFSSQLKDEANEDVSRVEGRESRVERPAPTNVGDYGEKGDGSSVASPHQESSKSQTSGVIPTNSDQLMGGGQEVEGRVTRVEGLKIAGKEDGGVKVRAARANGNEDGGWQEKSAPTNPAGRDDYEENGDGSSVASPHHEGSEASPESCPTELAGVKSHNNPPPGLWKLKSPNFYAQG